MADGNIERNGPLAVLVNQRSATSRMISENPRRTFAINENHSEMVKFSRESNYLDAIIPKLKLVISYGLNGDSGATTAASQPQAGVTQSRGIGEEPFSIEGTVLATIRTALR